MVFIPRIKGVQCAVGGGVVFVNREAGVGPSVGAVRPIIGVDFAGQLLMIKGGDLRSVEPVAAIPKVLDALQLAGAVNIARLIFVIPALQQFVVCVLIQLTDSVVCIKKIVVSLEVDPSIVFVKLVDDQILM